MKLSLARSILFVVSFLDLYLQTFRQLVGKVGKLLLGVGAIEGLRGRR